MSSSRSSMRSSGARGVSARRPGDAAVVFFRPEDRSDHHAARALRAARELLERLQERWPEEEIGFGITLTTGEVSLGWVGEAPPEPQILGDPVNVAFRLQSECRRRACPILADWETATADEQDGIVRSARCRCATVPSPSALHPRRAVALSNPPRSAPGPSLSSSFRAKQPRVLRKVRFVCGG